MPATMWLAALWVVGAFTMQAAAQTPKDWQYQVGEPATQARERWAQLTRGEELARGREVQFFPKPQYRLTTDENDPYDLTDGVLSSRADDRVWFNKDAVGWYGGVGTTEGVLMVIDLGAPQPIGQIAIRVLGGREQGSLELPSAIEYLASNDGKQYYRLQRTVKLNPAEKEQSDFKTGFYIPEEGTAFMTPLVSQEAVLARYVALRVRPQSSLFVDQISVLKAPASTVLQKLESYPKAQVYTDGFVVSPRQGQIAVTTNVLTPNWFLVSNNSGLDPAKSPLAFRLELPQGLRVLSASVPAGKEVTGTQPGTNAYEFAFNGKSNDGVVGPLWIEKVPDVTVPAGATAKLTGIVEGTDSHRVEVPLQLVEVPEVPAIRGLDVSLGWLHDAQQLEWPNFLRDFRKLGFGYVSTFPRSFVKDKDGKWSAATQKSLDFLQQARRANYGVVYNESPFHVMWSRIQADQKSGALEPAEAEQLFTKIDGRPGKQVNILYRGRYYQDEIRRIGELAALVQPDHVYLDIEWWHSHVSESRQDPRVIAAWKQSGKEWDDFVTDIGAEVLRAVVTAIRRAVPEKRLVIGTYNADPKNRIYDSVFQWDKIYPGIVDIAQPSLYVQGRGQLVAERIQFDFQAMQQRQIIPWLSAGTYGEFDPTKMELMVLEAILSGARGVTYYWFGDFDSMDFYYHAKALASLAPFEKLIQKGKPVEFKGDNSRLHYTAFASADEALLLVANYSGGGNGQVRVMLPLKGATRAELYGKSLTIDNGQITLDVPAGEGRLVWARR